MSQRRWSSKFTREMVREARGLGFYARQLSSGHWRITTPDGAFVTTVAGSSSDRKAVLAVRTRFKQATRRREAV